MVFVQNRLLLKLTLFNPSKWRIKHVIILAVCLLVVYLLLRKRVQIVEASTVINHATADEVWDFVADFNNMKYLNPTIKDFHIVSENGNFEKWTYQVTYVEELSHWPYSENINTGWFTVTNEEYDKVIHSRHQTCMWSYCLNSSGVFRFTDLTNGSTNVTETVQFECPFVMTPFCIREAMFQREAIQQRLRQHFDLLNKKQTLRNGKIYF